MNDALRAVYNADMLPEQQRRYEIALAKFRLLYGAGDIDIFRAPGRVNLIGEHTDYNHGYVMPVALDKDVLLLARPRADHRICLANIEEGYPAFEIDISQLDVGTPMGTITSTMNLSVPEADRDNFAWSSLLLSLNGELNLSVPEMLVQFASSMDPEAGALIGMGYLVKDGDAYTMDAKIAKGLLTVNGAPMPLPVGMFD